MRTGIFCLACLIFSFFGAVAKATDSIADDSKVSNFPALAREYRGVWVATVANIDWPSKPGLSTQQQQAETLAILDSIAAAKMNVVVLQVRTSCDALYASQLEPWSYFLTGKQGQAPEPYYDPLEFWVAQAHQRGLELHAWFNPFRAKNSGQSYPDCPLHISQTKPQLVKKYGNDKTSYLWLDPGEAEAREHSLAVFLDVLRRYDIDGIHIDDYFYPYPVDDIPFPDDPAWNAYQQSGGKLARDDWRRDSMNQFIRQLYSQIKQIKPHVKFGISPFGIWKPGYPASVAGFSQHDKLYADARLWLNEGWCDYYSPQLYWAISARQQSYPALLNWWIGENKQQRHIVPGIYTSRIGNKSKGYTADEVINQTYIAKHTPGSHGVIHFSMKSIQENREQIATQLRDGAYLDVAIPPALSWLDHVAPGKPDVSIERVGSKTAVRWKLTDAEAVSKFCLRTHTQGKWNIELLPSERVSIEFVGSDESPTAIAISAIDRFGNEGPAAQVQLKE